MSLPFSTSGPRATPYLPYLRRAWILSLVFFTLYGWLRWPLSLLQDPVCTVLTDRNGALLGARIAADGQWRFPQGHALNPKFRQALLQFEDKRFFRHPGIDPLAMARAVRDNLVHGRIVSGGSTLSMQVVRLSRKGRSRNIPEKLLETALAFRLEWQYDKPSILALYAANAPFGGNVVGLDAAAWRYFGKDQSALSWAEAALLAVLPNSPALLHPGRNRERLRTKRNRLLHQLQGAGRISAADLELALEEPLPEKPLPLPALAPHLLDRAGREAAHGTTRGGGWIRSTLDLARQQTVSSIARRRAATLRRNGIHNLAVLVLDVPTGEVRAYLGNLPDIAAAHSPAVDIVTAPRSTGSLLKPLLYACALQDGHILPRSLLPDIPTHLPGFHPRNFTDSYDGAVPADQALARSLNIPFVKLLQTYGVERFHFQLGNLGMSTLHRPASHYGLSLILGGAEATLWDLAGIYASMARTLLSYHRWDGRYLPSDIHPPRYLESGQTSVEQRPAARSDHVPPLRADAIWLTFEAMDELERPAQEGRWQQFGGAGRIAWKTGTSVGLRDAWAIGVQAEYVVAVWVGNADGEGRPGLTGISTAAPILFDIFRTLPAASWFEPPLDALRPTGCCRLSGFLASEHCPKDTIQGPTQALNALPCPYHHRIRTSVDGTERVSIPCLPPGTPTTEKTWFVLPPAMAHFFKPKHPDYLPLPPWRAGCAPLAATDGQVMQLIYPAPRSRLRIPRELDGTKGEAVFRIAHHHPEATLFWHLDDQFVGSTRTFHEMAFSPLPGTHLLTVVDADGNRLTQSFDILE